MGFFSLELVLFIAIIFVYTRLRQERVFPINMIRGLTLYLPPTDADFEVLQSTNKPARETLQGKKNKYDEKHESKQAKFPMRTFKITEELLQWCKEFFPEFEFLLMLFSVIIVLFSVVLLIKLFFPDRIETNLVLYMSVIVIILTSQNLNKDAFIFGFRNLTDETKV